MASGRVDGQESWASTANSRATMVANRRRDTGPELRVRRILHSQGLRYRVDFPPAPTPRRRADIVFPRQRVAVYIDGCFWHGCRLHYIAPKANATFWADKVARNQARDTETTEVLRACGWRVLRFWEHEEPHLVAESIFAAVREARVRGS
ncbi:very short patch repair endonuclease [Agromyces neolithicus]|uniref:Very short patch repair endonuclease n=1 Tax=Agromyces neolithicus TaxID=269420 RepID=A0ABN2M876_9MICO